MTEYDEFLYDDFPFSDTHPDRVGTVAALFGMAPAPPERCRVLELGCGLGGNLVPMALTLPDSQFVGIDASVRQIEAGLRESQALGLRNLSLIALDLRDVGPEFGEFDYIVCHGVYSWVPPDVQAAILEICRRHLAPQGVAYVSYNTLPGWHGRGMVRDILRRNVPPDAPAAERIAKARHVLQFLTDYLPPERNLLARWLRSEVDLLGDLSDAYLLHEHLCERNEPLWFRDFMERAAGAGLRYVGDVEFAMMMPERYGPDVAARLQSLADSQIEMEQYLDLLSTRFFRRTLLCHGEVKLDRGLSGTRLRELRVASRLSPTDPELDPAVPGEATFDGPSGAVLTTAEPLVKAALVALAERRPLDMPVVEVVAAARERLGRTGDPDADLDDLGAGLLEIYAQGLLELGRWRRPIAAELTPRPVAFGLARHRGARGADATPNLRHDSIALDRLDHVLLPLLDGTRDRDALVAATQAAMEAGAVQLTLDDQPVTDPEVILELVDRKLVSYVRTSLLLDAAPEPVSSV